MKCFYWLVPIIVKGKNYIRESDKVRSMEPQIQIDTQVVNQPVNLVLSGNAKRKQSCQRVGGEKKRVGHKREDDFKRQFHPASLTEVTEYGATSDTWLAKSSDIANTLRNKFELADRDLYVSNKSGNNIQLTLGKIAELEAENGLEWINDANNCRTLFNKYLKKQESVRPADLLVYKDLRINKWLFYKMDDVVDFIVNNVKWRKLDSGRIKGDFDDGSKKGYGQYITYEYRATHNSHFLGMNGNKGIVFIDLLKRKIPFHEENIDCMEV